MLLRDGAQSDLARRLRSAAPPSLGEVFSFLSSLYFRGKLAYAKAFTSPQSFQRHVLVITPNGGLMPVGQPITRPVLQSFAAVDIATNDPRYREPLERDVAELVRGLAADVPVVLLGSIATGKYVDVLLQHLGRRLLFPSDFVGRGDMSRGGLLLRAAADGTELAYTPVQGAVRTGQRPPTLTPRRSSQ